MRESAGQRDTEHERQAKEDGQAEHGHYRHCPAARQPPLEPGHDRIKYQCHEPGHDYEQLDFAQPVDELAQQVSNRDNRDRDQDGAERNPSGFGGDPKPRCPTGPQVAMPPPTMSGHPTLPLPIRGCPLPSALPFGLGSILDEFRPRLLSVRVAKVVEDGECSCPGWASGSAIADRLVSVAEVTECL